MEHMEAMVDLVRALSKKCEDYEQYKSNSESYRRWYHEEQDRVEKLKEEVDKLKTILQGAGIEY